MVKGSRILVPPWRGFQNLEMDEIRMLRERERYIGCPPDLCLSVLVFKC